MIGPTLGSRPRCGASRFHSGVSTGPNTAPSVPIHTTAAIARRTFAGLGEVGGDEPALQRRRLRTAEQHHADEQQPHPAHLSAERSDCGAARADHERRHQRRPPSAPLAECRERRRHQRRPERERGVAGPGEAVVAQQIADEQREDRNHAGDRRLPRHLRHAQRRDRSPLQRGGDRPWPR